MGGALSLFSIAPGSPFPLCGLASGGGILRCVSRLVIPYQSMRLSSHFHPIDTTDPHIDSPLGLPKDLSHMPTPTKGITTPCSWICGRAGYELVMGMVKFWAEMLTP